MTGKTTLASIKIDTVSSWDYVEVSVLIRNDVEVGQFQLEVDFCYYHLTFVGAELGGVLEEDDWEGFTYRLLPHTDSLYKVQLFGLYDIPDGHQGVPLGVNSEYVTLVVLAFVIDNMGFPDGTFFPITFEWEVSDCLDNTLQNLFYDTLYVSQDSTQFNTVDCPPESLEFSFISPSLEFSDGGITVFYPEDPLRGDINLNHIAYEVADLVLFSMYLQYGDSILVIDPEQQSANSDVNWDDFRWSMADFIHLGRVILNDAPEVVEPTSLSQHDAETWMTTMHALPNDTVVFPVLYRGSGTESVHGISFKIDYDPNSLSLTGVDFSETPLEDWELVQPRLEDGSVRLNACPEFFTTMLSDSLSSSGSAQTLARLIFEVSDVDTPTYLRVVFGDDTSSLVQANAFATIDGDLTRLGISDVRNGGIQVGGSLECKRGDVNFNSITYEVADWVLFQQFLLGGPGVFIYDPRYQMCATNANADSLGGTIADLLYLVRVILHDAVEIPLKSQSDGPPASYSDQLVLVSTSAHPGDVVSVPVWLSNSYSARGATFKLVFDDSRLSVEGVDTSGARIPGWEDVYPVIKPGELFFFTYGDWWEENNASYSSIEPGAGVLAGVDFRVDENAPAGTSIPVNFEVREDWGHYNSYTDAEGLVLVQPTTVSGWIFTDVISGDANSDGIVDVADLVYVINYLYRGGLPPSPVSLGDFNQDGEVNVADLVALINYLFRG
ncbi:MAG: cohesin domain-containing protein [Candidatus Zixiibacteriota bacterium]